MWGYTTGGFGVKASGIQWRIATGVRKHAPESARPGWPAPTSAGGVEGWAGTMVAGGVAML